MKFFHGKAFAINDLQREIKLSQSMRRYVRQIPYPYMFVQEIDFDIFRNKLGVKNGVLNYRHLKNVKYVITDFTK